MRTTQLRIQLSKVADLCKPRPIPPALHRAHQKIDSALDAAYQPSGGKKTYATDADRVAFLFVLYQRITSLLPAAARNKKQKKSHAICGGNQVNPSLQPAHPSPS